MTPTRTWQTEKKVENLSKALKRMACLGQAISSAEVFSLFDRPGLWRY
jgi:hypothetical protein